MICLSMSTICCVSVNMSLLSVIEYDMSVSEYNLLCVSEYVFIIEERYSHWDFSHKNTCH